jgi:hypothetical protein
MPRLLNPRQITAFGTDNLEHKSTSLFYSRFTLIQRAVKLESLRNFYSTAINQKKLGSKVQRF